jgi:hypothetical protein
MYIVKNPMLRSRQYVQYRFPKSKKKRIRKKWAKRPQNYRYHTEYQSVVIDGTIYVHPDVYELLKEKRSNDPMLRFVDTPVNPIESVIIQNNMKSWQ